MTHAASNRETGRFVLAVWCTVSKAWHDLPGRYESPGQAEDAATERGIYRVVFVCDGRRLALDPFAKIAGED
jgi:hypothetical protein